MFDLDAVTVVVGDGSLQEADGGCCPLVVEVEEVMTDNGSAYISTIHALACRALGIRHIRTRPYRPRTNGKAERFIRTMLGGWAYGAIYGSSRERQSALDGWLHFYSLRKTRSGSIGSSCKNRSGCSRSAGVVG